jgi:hypothetical protein
MKVSMLAAGVAAAVLGLSASAVPTTVTSLADQSGFFGLQNGVSYPITDTGFSFGPQANPFTSISGLTITVTGINDGDIGPTDYDFNNLFLGLNGVNTGIPLTTIASSNGNISSLTSTLTAPNAASSAILLAALNSNSPIAASFIDTTPLNSTPAGDTIGIASIGQASLTVVGDAAVSAVPLPPAAIISPLGIGLAGIYARRFRRGK